MLLPYCYEEAYGAEASGCCASGSSGIDSSEVLLLHSSTAAEPSTASAQCAGLGSNSLCAGEVCSATRALRAPVATGGQHVVAAAAPTGTTGPPRTGFWAAAARAYELVHVQTLTLKEAADLAESATLVIDSSLVKRLAPMAPVAAPAPCPPSPRPTKEEEAPHTTATAGSGGGELCECGGATTASGPRLRSGA